MSKDTAHYRNAREHAIQRAEQRYGLRLSVRDYRWLCNRLRNNIGHFFGVQDDGGEVWIASWHRKSLLCIYRRELNAIATFQPFDARVEVVQPSARRSA